MLQIQPTRRKTVSNWRAAASRFQPNAEQACLSANPQQNTEKADTKVPLPGIMIFKIAQTTANGDGMQGTDALKGLCFTFTLIITSLELSPRWGAAVH